MHQPIQPKSLSWWEEVGNSLILQHSPPRRLPQASNIEIKSAAIILFNRARQDLN